MTQHTHSHIDDWIQEGLEQLPQVEQSEDLVAETMDQVYEAARQQRSKPKRPWLVPSLTAVATLVVGWGTHQYGHMQASVPPWSYLFTSLAVLLVGCLWYWQLDRIASKQLSKWLTRRKRS